MSMEVPFKIVTLSFILLAVGTSETREQEDTQDAVKLNCASLKEKDSISVLLLKKPKPAETEPCPNPQISCLITASTTLRGINLKRGRLSYWFPFSTWKEGAVEVKLGAEQVNLVPNFTAVYQYNLPTTIETDGGQINIRCRESISNPNTPISTSEPPSPRMATKYIILTAFVSLIIYVILTVIAIIIYKKIKAKRRERSKGPVISEAMNQGHTGLTLGNGYTSLDMLHLENADVKQGMGEVTYVEPTAQNNYDNAEECTKPGQTGAYSYPYVDMDKSRKTESPKPKANRVAVQEKGIFYRQTSDIQYEDVNQTQPNDHIDTYTPANEENRNKYLVIH